MIADNFISSWSISAGRNFFRTTPQAPLRRHHIALIENLLLFFREQKDLFTLHTWNFYIGHILTSHVGQTLGVDEVYHNMRQRFNSAT